MCYLPQKARHSTILHMVNEKKDRPMKKLVSFMMLLALLLPMGSSFAQSPDDAPAYARYCDNTRRSLGEAPLRAALEDLEEQLKTVDSFLSVLGAGNRTFLEGITETQVLMTTWDETNKIDCMVAMHLDAQILFSELLIAMLYGQILDNANSQAHLATARAQLDTIRRESANALEYLAQPLPDLEEDPTAEPEITPEPEETEEPALRSGEELTTLLTDYLSNNGVTVLIDAGVQVFPGDTLIVIRLDRFTSASGQTFDYENTYFTFDVLARLIVDWAEVNEISRIAIETYDAANRVLYAEAGGDSFRAHYVENAISAEEFQQGLLVQEAIQ